MIQMKSEDNLTLGHAMETHRELGVQHHKFLTSTLVVDEWLASNPERFICGNHFIEDWASRRPVWLL
jgi:hypothetical protein